MKRGCIQIYTGNGKGKTTAALGLALRAVGAGLRVYIGQFLKQGETGENKVLHERFPEVTVEQFGSAKGLIIRRGVAPEDTIRAREGLVKGREALLSGRYDVVILDEILVAAGMGLIGEEDVLSLMELKPGRVELVLTGRGAREAITARADLVSEIMERKHYFHEGLQAREGIEL